MSLTVQINSTKLDCDGKFNNYWNSSFKLQKINDRLCREYGMSVIEEKKAKGKGYGEWKAQEKGTSWKAKLKKTIDEVLENSTDFEDFLKKMQEQKVEIKTGKHIAFRAEGQIRFIRGKTLGSDYTEEIIRARMKRTISKNTGEKQKRKVNLLINIQEKLNAGKGEGYERWAKVYNLKEAAKTLNFLTEQGIVDYDELLEKTKEMNEKFNTVSAKIKNLEKQMARIEGLKKTIMNYGKTRSVYLEYKKSKEKNKFYLEHKEEILLHEQAKKVFQNLKEVPKMEELKTKYGVLLLEKKECYEEYKKCKLSLIEFENAKQNVEILLNGKKKMEKDAEVKKETIH